jgi:hypothetical protein
MGATHVIVFCDTFDHEDYPTYVMPGTDPRVAAKGGEMQVVMEVYALHLDLEAQLSERRAFHYDLPPAATAATKRRA